MTRLRIDKIIWDKLNSEHIKKHAVSVKEVEKAISLEVYIKEGKLGRKLIIGKTGLRLLTIVGSMKGNKIYIVTARDASVEERKEYYEFEKEKNN